MIVNIAAKAGRIFAIVATTVPILSMSNVVLSRGVKSLKMEVMDINVDP
jgi:hypothetical protein